MKYRNRGLSTLFFVLALAWMGVIYYLSAQDGNESSLTSGFFTGMLLRLLRVDEAAWAADGRLAQFHAAVRTFAHFSEYAVLGMLSLAAWKFAGLKYPWLPAQGMAMVWAALDEWHQAYVPGRACQWQDMLVDSLGAAFGILVLTFLIWIIGRIVRYAAQSHRKTE